MRFDINLATHPYEDARQFYIRWGAVLAATALLTMFLLSLLYLNWRNSRDIEARITELHRKINLVDDERATNEAVLNRAVNLATRNRSTFLNALIVEKSFSWTEVLSDLEDLVPAGAHVLAIQPRLGEDSQLSVAIDAESQSRDTLLLLARHLENSAHFRYPVIRAENNSKTPDGQVSIKFVIDALYAPGKVR